MRSQWSVFGRAQQTWFAGILFGILAAASAWCQGLPAATLPALTADEIVHHLVEKNRERAGALEHYSAVRRYRLEYRGFPYATEATMVVNVTYDAPGSKRFTVISSSGAKLIESRVFARLLESEQQAGGSGTRSGNELGPDNYLFSLSGVEGSAYVLNVEPRSENKFLYRGKIWVDGHDFAVTRIEAQPARNPSFWTTKSLIHHTYQKVEGGFYLPKENKTVTSVRLGGTATLTIDYGAYQVVPAAPATTAAKMHAGSAEGSFWPDGSLNVALASYAGGKK